jgi:hypothetical protein
MPINMTLSALLMSGAMNAGEPAASPSLGADGLQAQDGAGAPPQDEG